MKTLALLFVTIALAGCAQWDTLSDTEKTSIIIGGAILVGANIIKNSQGDTIVNQNCVKDHAAAICPWER